MQPLNLPEESHWRVIFVRKIKLSPSRKNYSFEVIFEQLSIGEHVGDYPKKFQSVTTLTRTVNLNLIKFFAIGTIWSDDKIVSTAENFESFSAYRSSIDFELNRIESKTSTYLNSGFYPELTMENEGAVCHNLLVYEDDFSKKITSAKGRGSNSTPEKVFDIQFIAIPSYEIARFFLFGTGVYNGFLLQSNLYVNTENKIFDNDQVYFDEQTKTLDILLKSGVSLENAQTIGDLCSFESYRCEAQKLSRIALTKTPDFSDLLMPIRKFERITFKAKRVKNNAGNWGLLILFFEACIGHREYVKLNCDTEDGFRKKTTNKHSENDYNPDVSGLTTINTGNLENYIDDENTNNSIPAKNISSNLKMNNLLIDFDNIEIEKKSRIHQNNSPTRRKIQITNTQNFGQITGESSSSSDIAPQDVKDVRHGNVFDSSQMRDNSSDSNIYSTRYFQDFEIIVQHMFDILRKQHRNTTVKYGKYERISNNDSVNFQERPATIDMSNLLIRKNITCSFTFRKGGKIKRKIYLIEVKVDFKTIYLLEPEFKSENATASSLIFYDIEFAQIDTSQLFQFFDAYVTCKGVKSRMVEMNKISEKYFLIATNHDLIGDNTHELMKVKEALLKHASKMSKKIIDSLK